MNTDVDNALKRVINNYTLEVNNMCIDDEPVTKAELKAFAELTLSTLNDFRKTLSNNL